MSDAALLPTNFPVLTRQSLCSDEIIPCSVEQGIRALKPLYYAINCGLWCSQNRDFAKFPVKFPVSRENEQSRGILHCRPSHPVQSLEFSRQCREEARR